MSLRYIKYTFFILLLSVQSYGGIVIINGLTHNHRISPGSQLQNNIIIKNIGKEEIRVVFFQKDLGLQCDVSGYTLDSIGSNKRTNGSWIEIGEKERILGPGDEYPLSYIIRAPKEDLSGTFWSTILVEEKPKIDTLVQREGIGISNSFRYAIQIISSFPKFVPAQIEFNRVQFKEELDGTSSLVVNLKNTCDKLLFPKTRLEVYNEKGDIIFEATAVNEKLYPDYCKNYIIDTRDIPSGKYKAVVLVDCGEADLFGQSININIDD